MSKRSRVYLNLAVVALRRVILPVYGVDRLGFRKSTTVSTETTDRQGNKSTAQIYQRTVRDLLNLLIVPLVLAVGVFLWKNSEQRRQAKVAAQRAETERNQAIDRMREDRLQAYLDHMQDLLLSGLKTAPPESVLRDVARARTLTVLRGLDSERNNLVLHFLRDSELIAGDSPVVSLSEAYLSKAELGRADLFNVDLSGAFLLRIDLSDAQLMGADLSDAQLMGANLRGANLSRANLSGADLSDADLSHAKLNNADLSEAKLSGATMPDGTKHS